MNAARVTRIAAVIVGAVIYVGFFAMLLLTWSL